MRLIFSNTDKKRIKVFMALIVAGLLIMGFAASPFSEAPQCGVGSAENLVAGKDDCIVGADIGRGMIFYIGIIISQTAGFALVASLIFSQANRNSKSPLKASLFSALIIACVVLFGWFIFIKSPALKATKHERKVNSDLQVRTSKFVEYKGSPKLSSVTSQSGSLTVEATPGKAIAVSLDLYTCEPGSAKVTYGTTTTHFIFSGISKDNQHSDYYNCVFYLDYEQANQKWDDLLHIRCDWMIYKIDVLKDNKEYFQLTDKGLKAVSFPFCYDVRTGQTAEFN